MLLPVVIPVRFPEPSISILPLLLLQTPPVVASLKLDEGYIHTDDGPAIAAGKGLTVTTVVE